MISGYPPPCKYVWNDLLRVHGERRMRPYKTRSPPVWSIEKKVRTDGDEVVKMLDENVNKRKNNATGWDKTCRCGTLFYPLVDLER